MAQQAVTESPLTAYDRGHDDRRVKTVSVSQYGTLIAAAIYNRHHFPTGGRILSVKGFRRTAGGANASTVDVKLNGTSILAAVMSFAAADGANLTVNPTLDTAHANYDSATGTITFNASDYLEVSTPAVETVAPSGLSVDIHTMV